MSLVRRNMIPFISIPTNGEKNKKNAKKFYRLQNLLGSHNLLYSTLT